jgi:hypothetical protein
MHLRKSSGSSTRRIRKCDTKVKAEDKSGPPCQTFESGVHALPRLALQARRMNDVPISEQLDKEQLMISIAQQKHLRHATCHPFL